MLDFLKKLYQYPENHIILYLVKKPIDFSFYHCLLSTSTNSKRKINI